MYLKVLFKRAVKRCHSLKDCLARCLLKWVAVLKGVAILEVHFQFRGWSSKLRFDRGLGEAPATVVEPTDFLAH